MPASINYIKNNHLSVVFYNIFLILYRLALFVVSPFNPKAKKWIQGRKGIFKRLKNDIGVNDKLIWFHCASLGEFEQGRPILERIRTTYPEYKILLTFFSPSGFEAQKKYSGADWVFYLPMDGARNAKRFLELTNPSLVIFVKYEFWYYYLKKIKYRDIPLLLVSALFREDMSFFKWYGSIQRKILSRFNWIFVQDLDSKSLLDGIGLSHITSVSGDTRFDRVIEIAEKFKPIDEVEKFSGTYPVLVAGSTWPEDEEMLHSALASLTEIQLKLIIAPHEISKDHIENCLRLFPGSILFSQLKNNITTSEKAFTLIIDNIGMLSRLYSYGTITYVGGGLKSSGVHNVLEAAVFNKPVIIGPYHEKYKEATGLVKAGGCFVIKSPEEMTECIKTLLKNSENCCSVAAKKSGEFVRSNAGASEKILAFIQEKRLLTN